MRLKNFMLIAIILVMITTLGMVSASQSNVTGDSVTLCEDMSFDEDIVGNSDNETIKESDNVKSNDTLENSNEDTLAKDNYFVDVSEAYTLLNEFRRESGVWFWNEDDTTKSVFNTNSANQLNTLVRDADLEKTAQIRAKEIYESFSHTRPDGSSCFTVYPDNMWAYGENIASGQRTCKEVTEAWKETNYLYSGQGHRRNMLSDDFNCVGIAGFKYNGVIYWVQAFGYSDHPNTNYNDANTNTKLTPVIKASSKKTFKLKTKSKKYTVTLKYGKKAIKKVQVNLKIAKKTFKVKTNNKGKATFKIKLNEKGKFKGVITFKGNSNYNKITKKVKIIIK